MLQGRVKIILSMLIWGSVGIFARYSGLDGLRLAFYPCCLQDSFRKGGDTQEEVGE